MKSDSEIIPIDRPRLALRLGALGNRKFGRMGSTPINEDPDQIEQAVQSACDDVLEKIEACLVCILNEEKQRSSGVSTMKNPKSLFATMKAYRDGSDSWDYGEENTSVFADDHPVVQVLHGGAAGADTIIKDAAERRNLTGKAEWKTFPILPESPSSVRLRNEGLGLGNPVTKREDIKRKLEKNGVLSRREAAALSTSTRKRAFAYRAQSEALRHHSDILLAVWDPDVVGKPGGTAESVEFALRERITVIALVLREKVSVDITILESLDDLNALNRNQIPRSAQVFETELTKVLKGVIAFPDTVANETDHFEEHSETTAYNPRKVFLAFIRNRPFRPTWFARLWTTFDCLLKFRLAQQETQEVQRQSQIKKEIDDQETNTQRKWDKFRESFWSIFAPAIDLPKNEKLPISAENPEPSTFESCYGQVRKRAASAGMSGVFGDAHRGGIIASYAFAAIAVMFAVLGGIAHAQEWMSQIQIVFALCEIAAIVVMYLLQKRAKNIGWNLAYTHSRILAEALRHMEYLGPLGVHTPLPRLPAYLQHDRKNASPDELWSVWYFRALVRMAPMRLKSSNGDQLGDHQQSVVNWIDNQIRYHRANAKKQHLLHIDIESISLRTLLIVFIFAFLHLADVVRHWHLMFIPSAIICIGGPALIAAMHGFASQIESSRLQRRSANMEKLLTEQKKRIESLDLNSDPEDAETVWTLSVESLAISSLMMDESAGWSLLYTNTDIHAG